MKLSMYSVKRELYSLPSYFPPSINFEPFKKIKYDITKPFLCSVLPLRVHVESKQSCCRDRQLCHEGPTGHHFLFQLQQEIWKARRGIKLWTDEEVLWEASSFVSDTAAARIHPLFAQVWHCQHKDNYLCWVFAFILSATISCKWSVHLSLLYLTCHNRVFDRMTSLCIHAFFISLK